MIEWPVSKVEPGRLSSDEQTGSIQCKFYLWLVRSRHLLLCGKVT